MRNLHPPSPSVFFKLFDAQMLPTLLTVVGTGKEEQCWNCTLRLPLRAFFSVDLPSPNNMCYGELGRFPLFIITTIHAIKLWFRLLDYVKCLTVELPSKLL